MIASRAARCRGADHDSATAEHSAAPSLALPMFCVVRLSLRVGVVSVGRFQKNVAVIDAVIQLNLSSVDTSSAMYV